MVAVDIAFQPMGQARRAATLDDLGETGARISAAEPCAEGDAVVIELPWPSRDNPTRVNAVVRWVDGSRMGVQFDSAGASESPANATSSESAFARDELRSAEGVVHQMTRPVRFQEVDAAGTIYYARVYEYFGDAYVGMLEQGGVNVATAMRDKLWFAPLVHSEADYLAPMRYGDTVVVQVVKVDCRTSAATVGYRITSPEGRVLAVGYTVHVFVDSTFRRCPVPTDVRRALTAPAPTNA